MELPQKKANLLGKLVSKVQFARWNAKRTAVEDLLKRNGLDSPHATGYKIEEVTAVHRDGEEVTTFRLYKLVDKSVVIVSSEVKTQVETGLSAAEDPDELRRRSEENSKDSPI